MTTASQIRRQVAELIRPPRRIPVSQAAASYLNIVDGGGRVYPWNPHETPYMLEPMNCLASRDYDAVVFMGPARTGKTQALLEGFLAYMITCDPADTLIVQVSEDKAAEYSKKRLSRSIRHSPELLKRMSERAHDNNVHEIILASGAYLAIKWPSVNVLSSSDFRFVLITDFDRMAENIGGEGNAYILGSKRTQSYMSAGCTLVESSPGKAVSAEIQADWQAPADQPHLAPIATGISSLYNQGDRRRLHWQCLACGNYFTPSLENWDHQKKAPYCPRCGVFVAPEAKHQHNLNHRWVPEGMQINESGQLIGERRKTRIASFWMEGPAAVYQNWDSLQSKLNDAESIYQNTGSEESLKGVINVDWGRPYIPKPRKTHTSSTRLMDRATQHKPKAVPEGVRFLTLAIDVQGGKNRRFVVQVQGWGEDKQSWLIDRFNIRQHQGRDIDPSEHLEDWDAITQDLLNRTYPLENGQGTMKVLALGVDTGGEAGVTHLAFDYYRQLKKIQAPPFYLLKGDSKAISGQTIRITWPNGAKKKANAATRGDIPLHLLNTNRLKDRVSLQLNAKGANALHLPNWLPEWFYKELAAETRDHQGKWTKISDKAPNEAFDLCAYNLAIALQVGLDKINWDAPPAWALPQAQNPLVTLTLENTSSPPAAKPKKRKRVIGGIR